MALWVCFGFAVAIGLFLLCLPTGGNLKTWRNRLLGTLGFVAIFCGVSFVATFLIAVQGDPYSETELISSRQIEDVGYSESSTRRGQLIGNYTYRVAQLDDSGAQFFISESVPSGSTRLYIDGDLDGSRIEQHQGYWYEPSVFPWRIWSHQPYRLYSSEDPR